MTLHKVVVMVKLHWLGKLGRKLTLISYSHQTCTLFTFQYGGVGQVHCLHLSQSGLSLIHIQSSKTPNSKAFKGCLLHKVLPFRCHNRCISYQTYFWLGEVWRKIQKMKILHASKILVSLDLDIFLYLHWGIPFRPLMRICENCYI